MQQGLEFIPERSTLARMDGACCKRRRAASNTFSLSQEEQRRTTWLAPSASFTWTNRSKVKYTLSGTYHALANHLSGPNAPRDTLPWRIVQKGPSQEPDAGPRDRSKLHDCNWHPWAAKNSPGPTQHTLAVENLCRIPQQIICARHHWRTRHI